MSARKIWLLAALACGLWTCGEAPSVEVLTCNANSQCPSGWHCGPKGTCRADTPCADDTGCCYGERCEGGHCHARQACSATAGCMDPADTCTLGLCVPRTCASTDSATTCGKGRQCLWGRCVAQLPCGGHCGPGMACAVLINRCVAAAAPPCVAGDLGVVTNEIDRMPEGCAAIAPKVTCMPLPPLPEGQRGLPGQLLAAPGQLLHVSYDSTYGDLVLARHNASPPFALKSLAVLSGLPAAAPVIGAVTGPRGGVAEPGPDHGRRFDAVLGAAGLLQLAYRDDSADALRYAELAGDGSVTSHQIAAGGGLGEQIAVTLSAAGLPVVVAFAPEATAPLRAARVQVFAAKVAKPANPADWAVTELDTEAVVAPAPPCGGACPGDQACVDVAGKPTCQPTAASCAPCLPGMACVAAKCVAVFVAPPELDRGPLGRGAALDAITLASGALVVAAHSPMSGDLALYQFTAGKWQKSLVPAAAIAQGSTQFGRFVRLVEGDGGKIWLACEDADRGRLLVARQTDKGFVVDVADDGARKDGVHRVGADIAVIRHPFGGLLLAHQDTRRADLLLQKMPKPGVVGGSAVLQTQDMAGFSPSIVQLGTKAFVIGATTLRLGADGQLRSTVQLHDLVWTGD